MLAKVLLWRLLGCTAAMEHSCCQMRPTQKYPPWQFPTLGQRRKFLRSCQIRTGHYYSDANKHAHECMLAYFSLSPPAPLSSLSTLSLVPRPHSFYLHVLIQFMHPRIPMHHYYQPLLLAFFFFYLLSSILISCTFCRLHFVVVYIYVGTETFGKKSATS